MKGDRILNKKKLKKIIFPVISKIIFITSKKVLILKIVMCPQFSPVNLEELMVHLQSYVTLFHPKTLTSVYHAIFNSH